MRRAVRTLIRIVAVALVIFGVLELALEYARQRTADIRWSEIILGSVLIIAGIALLATSARLAEKFTDDFEE